MITQGEDVEIHALQKQGWSLSAIARHVGRDRKTVRAYLNGDRQPAATSRRPRWPNSPSRATLTQSRPNSRPDHTEHHTRNPTTPRGTAAITRSASVSASASAARASRRSRA